jgi:cardiolipin synthase (CMP-forming)
VFFTVANALTASRLLLLPVIICAIVQRVGYLAVAAMALVVITDLLDGRIARRMGQSSAFGGTFDSTIDFVLIYSIFITFFAAGRFALYEFLVIYLAMLTTFVMQIGSMGSGQSDGVVKSRTGKLTGASQYAFLLFMVASEVLPKRPAVVVVHNVLFAILAAAIAISSVGAVLRLRKLV